MNRQIKKIKENQEDVATVISTPTGTMELDFQISAQVSKNTGDKFDFFIGFNEENGDGAPNSNISVKYGSGYYPNTNKIPIQIGNNGNINIQGKFIVGRDKRVRCDFKVWEHGNYAPVLGYFWTDKTEYNDIHSVLFNFKNQSNQSATLSAGTYFALESNYVDEKIALCGDSITADYSEIFDAFNNTPFTSKNLGFPGKGVNYLLNQLKMEDLTNYEEINIMIGINDRALNIDDFMINYTNLYNYVMANKKSETVVNFISLIVPCATGDNMVNGVTYDEKINISSLNNQIKDLVGDDYIDMNKEMITTYGYMNKIYSRDGLHFNDTGHTQFAKYLNHKISRRR